VLHGHPIMPRVRRAGTDRASPAAARAGRAAHKNGIQTPPTAPRARPYPVNNDAPAGEGADLGCLFPADLLMPAGHADVGAEERRLVTHRVRSEGTPPAARNATLTRAVASCSPGRTALSTARTSVGARTVAPASVAWNVAPSIPASRVNVSSPEARNLPREGRLRLSPRRRPTTWPLGIQRSVQT